MADRRIVLITGGNTGIGYEAVKAFLQSDKSYHVLMGSRSIDKAMAAIEQLKSEVPETANTVDVVQIDIASDQSIEKAFDYIKTTFNRIDALVNNADPRLLFVTSGLSSLQQTSNKFYPTPNPPKAGWPKSLDFDTMAYRSSKTALNMMMVNWAWRLTEDGVKTWCVSPGFLATGLGNEPELLRSRGAGHPSVGGVFIKNVVEGLRDEDVGKVVHSSGQVQPF
ncbi:hypothetical protein G7054_g13290 [Neopestalotiopsis clavispora]|nr:hypothetical protein G7054_g13290 [Neopestalotiopsis clavispora]